MAIGEESREDGTHPPLEAVAGNSMAVAMWTMVSRVTGVGKVIATGAVLGPTYLGNTYQATNLLPNVYLGFLAGSLFASLLVPPLVRQLDRGDRAAAQRLASGFVGLVVIAFTAMAALVVVAGPLVLRVLTASVEDPAIAASQRRIGLPLLAMFMPQLVLYGVAGTAAAVMNAHRRFALAAAAPALENIGIMATLGVTAVVFGTGTPLDRVSTPQLLVLGLGTTSAVGLHAAAQWWGAHRLGITLVPRVGWRDPEVREVLRRVGPSLGHGALGALLAFTILVVANRVPGGVLAFQLALNFYQLPIALAPSAVGLALLPQLARLDHQGNRQAFRSELGRGLGLAFFLTVPVTVAYVVLAYPLSRAIAYGEISTATGVRLIAVSLAALGVGMLGETAFVIGVDAFYARRDVRTPLLGMAIRTVLSVAGMLAASLHHGVTVLVMIGLSYSVANFIGAGFLLRRLGPLLPPARDVGASLARAGGAAAAMVLPAFGVAVLVPSLLGGPLRHSVGMALAAAVGAATYFAVQRALKSPELTALVNGLPLVLSRADTAAEPPASDPTPLP